MVLVLLRKSSGTSAAGSVVDMNARKAHRLVTGKRAEYTDKPVTRQVPRKTRSRRSSANASITTSKTQQSKGTSDDST